MIREQCVMHCDLCSSTAQVKDWPEAEKRGWLLITVPDPMLDRTFHDKHLCPACKERLKTALPVLFAKPTPAAFDAQAETIVELRAQVARLQLRLREAEDPMTPFGRTSELAKHHRTPLDGLIVPSGDAVLFNQADKP